MIYMIHMTINIKMNFMYLSYFEYSNPFLIIVFFSLTHVSNVDGERSTINL